MSCLSQHQAILLFLQTSRGWVPGYCLSKAELNGIWVGSRGERSARDLVSPECPPGMENKVERMLGKDLIAQGFTHDAMGKPIDKKYVYYRSIEECFL